MIDQIAISGYRSIRSLVLRLDQLNVVTGPNGSGKSSLYRAIRLLADAAEGRLLHSLAREGGLESTLWAGPEKFSREMVTGQLPVQGTLRRKPISLQLGFTSNEFSYCLDLGLPQRSESAFSQDPEIKRECLWRGSSMLSRSLCADRRKCALKCRAENQPWRDIELSIAPQSSMLTEYVDPFGCPELILMRDSIRSWRFYDTFRADAMAPARRVAVGTFTPVMSNDGGDLAAALQTILEVGDSEGLRTAVDSAFPGSEIRISNERLGMQLSLKQPGMLRDLSAAELSDGTLRFLLWVAALLTPRPPTLMVINEPETSLHPDLIPALARLIVAASNDSQLIVVTHSEALIDQVCSQTVCESIRLQKRLGETINENNSSLNQYGWKWPSR